MTPAFFTTLREANLARLPLFKNGKGEPAHTHPRGQDWTTAQWLQALVGEVGEYANFRKKYERGDMDRHEFLSHAEFELADIMTYTDLLLLQHGLTVNPDLIDTYLTRKFMGVNYTAAEWMQLIQSYLGRYAEYELTDPRARFEHSHEYPAPQMCMCGVVACLYKLCGLYGLNLEDATIEKFNLVSERVDCPVRIGKDGVWNVED